jgi:hypothetical protein
MPLCTALTLYVVTLGERLREAPTVPGPDQGLRRGRYKRLRPRSRVLPRPLMCGAHVTATCCPDKQEGRAVPQARSGPDLLERRQVHGLWHRHLGTNGSSSTLRQRRGGRGRSGSAENLRSLPVPRSSAVQRFTGCWGQRIGPPTLLSTRTPFLRLPWPPGAPAPADGLDSTALRLALPYGFAGAG